MIKAYFFDWMKTLGDCKDVINFKEVLTPEEEWRLLTTSDFHDFNIDSKRKEIIHDALNGAQFNLYSDSLRIIKNLKNQSYMVGIISNTYCRTPDRLRNSFSEIFRYFDVESFSSELEVSKPNPEIFVSTLKILNDSIMFNIQPSEVKVIGDSYNCDIAPALALGMRAGQIDRTKQNLEDVL